MRKLALFLLTILSGSLYASPIYNVCTITINSNNEAKTFQKYLSQGENKNRFKFIELTHYQSAPDKNDWFDRSCKADVQCDILVISGHFSGRFFSDYNSILDFSQEQMEKATCENSCSGIMQKPKEVFLFGCNTLAEKELDHRNPEEYFNVLINDGFTSEEAERMVQTRYGEWGSSFKDIMIRSFKGVPHIYGFNSTSPLGAVIQPYLANYLQEVSNYAQHLEELSSTKNTTLKSHLGQFPLVETSGQVGHSEVSENICSMKYHSNTSSEKFQIVEKLLSDENFLYYLDITEDFLRHIKNKGISLEEEQNLLLLQQNQKISDNFLEFLSLSFQDPQVIPYLNLSLDLALIREDDFYQEEKAIILEKIKHNSLESAQEEICQHASYKMKLRAEFNPSDFPTDFFEQAISYPILGCIQGSLELAEFLTDKIIQNELPVEGLGGAISALQKWKKKSTKMIESFYDLVDQKPGLDLSSACLDILRALGFDNLDEASRNWSYMESNPELLKSNIEYLPSLFKTYPPIKVRAINLYYSMDPQSRPAQELSRALSKSGVAL